MSEVVTLVRTAIDAYELPKLIPTTVGMAETSIGASAVPFGLDAISVACSEVESSKAGTRTRMRN